MAVTASSSNESVAAVAMSNNTLTVTAKSRGSATITVTAQVHPDGNQVSDTFDATVPAAEAAQQQQVEPPPGQVVNLSVRQVQPTQIRVEWDAPEDGGAVNSYRVGLSRDGEELSTRRPGVKKQYVVIRKLEPGATYTVSVRAQNAGGLCAEATTQTTLMVSVGDDDPAEVPAR